MISLSSFQFSNPILSLVTQGKLTPHQRPNTSHQIDQSTLDARVACPIAAAERGLRDCVGPSDCGSCQYVWEGVWVVVEGRKWLKGNRFNREG
jgi:hypothetical protein